MRSTRQERRRGGQRPERQSVVTGCDAPEVFLLTMFPMSHRALQRRLVNGRLRQLRLDRLGSALKQFSQLGAGVGLIAAHVFRWFHFADAVAGHRAVMGVAQQDGKKASLSICMDLRVAPASRAANRLLCSLFPLPPSDAPWGVDHLPSLSPSRRPEQIFPARPNARNGYRSLSAVRTRADNRTSRFSARARCHR
jgi:hypothetical protein